ncbi:DUF2244 domain-containing protein [Devosia sp. MC1541]|uniref:DUF2244 domain-containing protein n=1 Tax=Devosia sp. MC1541 TaxID=2725264 RepID=UPI00145C6496|nr:DUF2244 domain-containing protein [Devosia sp. MC1541]
MQVTTNKPLFAATLRPDRAMRLTGGWMALVVAFLGVMPVLMISSEYLLTGALAFACAAVGLIVYGQSQRRKTHQTQTVTLWPEQLEVVEQGFAKPKRMQRFDPNTVRLVLHRDAFERTTQILLKHEDEIHELGAFLSMDDKGSFAKAFGAALRQARRNR